MTSFKSSAHFFFLLAAFLVVSACTPKATEKKAVCGVNQAFNSVTRSCYSIAETRNTPIGTKATDTLSEEVAKTITLSYTDANSNLASLCKVTVSTPAAIEMMSPVVMSGDLYNKADEVYNSAHDMATTIVGLGGAAASAPDAAMLTALDRAKASFSNTTITAQMGVFRNAVNAIMTLAGTAPYSLDSNVAFFKDLTTTRLAEYNVFHTFLQNRCECTAGVCTTTIIPKLGKSGTAGFSYTITDVDGEGSAKTVSLSVSALSTASSHLRPTAESMYITGVESDTSVASSYSITFPEATDLFSTAASSFRYYFNGSKNGVNEGITTNGKVTHCMDLRYSTGLNDKSCLYTPTDGDASNDASAPAKATATISNYTFTAKANGTYGNNITVQFLGLANNALALDANLTETQKFGMVDSTSEAFVRVYGNDIVIYFNPGVTTAAQVNTLLAANPKVNGLVTISGAQSTLPSSMASATALTGGADAYDKFSYYANNLLSNSVNSATGVIRLTSANDLPMVPNQYNGTLLYTEAFVEETLKTLTLDFKDVDNYVNADDFTLAAKVDTSLAGACITNMTVPIFNMITTSPLFTITGTGTTDSINCNSTSKVCQRQIDVTPGTNVSGDVCLYYMVTDLSGTAVSSVQAVKLSVTNVNDAPTLTIDSGYQLISASSTATHNLAVVPATVTIPENSTGTPSSGYLCVTGSTGGGTYEASQTLSITATQIGRYSGNFWNSKSSRGSR
jgi:hypothetical protein